ncbi:MAG: hypothetical protein ACTSQF_00150 [Candidatus Heimdallarchaeaceae archaeon]
MQPKILNHISVKDENAVFGIMREAGTTIYDKKNKKTYLLLKTALSLESLTSFDNKKELRKPVIATTTMEVGSDSGNFGYQRAGFGTLNPTTIDGIVVDRIDTLSVGIITIIEFSAMSKINELDIITVDFGAIHTGKVFTWQGANYVLSDAALSAFIESEDRNDIILTFTV